MWIYIGEEVSYPTANFLSETDNLSSIWSSNSKSSAIFLYHY